MYRGVVKPPSPPGSDGFPFPSGRGRALSTRGDGFHPPLRALRHAGRDGFSFSLYSAANQMALVWQFCVRICCSQEQPFRRFSKLSSCRLGLVSKYHTVGGLFRVLRIRFLGDSQAKTSGHSCEEGDQRLLWIRFHNSFRSPVAFGHQLCDVNRHGSARSQGIRKSSGRRP